MVRVSVIAIGVCLFSAAAGCVKIATNSGHSMEPTLQAGERLILTYRPGRADRGDIVTFQYPRDQSKTFVARVIAVPGDTISSADGAITLNGALLEEPYVAAANQSHDSWTPQTIPAESYFVMGDHRNNSSDSRSWGMVPAALIQAKVVH